MQVSPSPADGSSLVNYRLYARIGSNPITCFMEVIRLDEETLC